MGKEIDPNAKFGNTSPVAECAKFHGVPVDMAYVVVDTLIHGARYGAFVAEQYQIYANLPENIRFPLAEDLAEIARRAS
jgi:hypothetical protein